MAQTSRSGCARITCYGFSCRGCWSWRPPSPRRRRCARVVVDAQAVGGRYYASPPTGVLLLGGAGRRGRRAVVLDRPDPIGGMTVQGDVREAAGGLDAAGLDCLPLPMRHGMTLGEILRFANDVYALHADLTVVPVAGWRRGMYYDAPGLPWVKPSPNMPDPESATHYPGLCLFEATNLSVGRGTPFAFQAIGAPWLDTAALLRHVRSLGRGQGRGLEGVAMWGDTITPHAPTDGKYVGVRLNWIRLRGTNRIRYDPTHAT